MRYLVIFLVVAVVMGILIIALDAVGPSEARNLALLLVNVPGMPIYLPIKPVLDDRLGPGNAPLGLYALSSVMWGLGAAGLARLLNRRNSRRPSESP